MIWRDGWWDFWFFDDRSESGSFGCQAVPFLNWRVSVLRYVIFFINSVDRVRQGVDPASVAHM